MKERAVELIERIPDEKMFYVINILQNLEEMSSNRPADKKQAMEALQNVLSSAEDYRKILTQIRNYRRQGRKSMVILVDTNIIIDALANREPYAESAIDSTAHSSCRPSSKSENALFSNAATIFFSFKRCTCQSGTIC